MVMVCIHHPLNPKIAKQCIELGVHDPRAVTELELPFSTDKLMFHYALESMSDAGQLTKEEGQEVFETVKRKQDEMINKINQARWVIPTSSERDPLNLNDPRISEINIKYRD